MLRLAARGHGGAVRRGRRRRRGLGPRRARRRVRRADSRDAGTTFEERARRRCRGHRARRRRRRPASLGARVTRTHPYLDRYRGDGEPGDPRPLRPAPVPRGDLPPDRPRRRRAARRARHRRVVAPRSRRPARHDGREAARRGHAVVRRPSTRSSATPEPPPRSSVPIGALDAARHGRASSASAAGAPTGIVVIAERAVPGAASIADASSTAAARSPTPRRCARRNQLVATGETVPMGVPPESAQLVRGADEILGLLGARCVDCGTINTPPSIHPHCISCGSVEVRARPRSPATASSTRSSSTTRCRRRSRRRSRSPSSTSTTAPG